jgi:hypothetical protein
MSPVLHTAIFKLPLRGGYRREGDGVKGGALFFLPKSFVYKEQTQNVVRVDEITGKNCPRWRRSSAECLKTNVGQLTN